MSPPITARDARQARLNEVFWWEPQQEALDVTRDLRSIAMTALSSERNRPPLVNGGEVRTLLEFLTLEDLLVLIDTDRDCRGGVNDINNHYLVFLAAATLATAPINAGVAREHANCSSPWHQVALVMNPFVPRDVASTAVTNALASIRDRRSLDKADLVVGSWYAVVMARGWLEPELVSLALGSLSAEIADAYPELGGFLVSWASGALDLPPPPPGSRESALRALRGGQAGFPVLWSLPRGEANDDLLLAYAEGLRSAPESTQAYTYLSEPFLPLLGKLTEAQRVLAARHGKGDALATLVSDPARRVRQHVARNKATTPDLVDRLLLDPDPRVRSQLARRSDLTSSILAALAADPDRAVQRAATRAVTRSLGGRES